MNIQQSLNQLLTTATIGAGIYTQTPEFRRKQELRQLKADIKAQQKAADLIAEEGELGHAVEASEKELALRKRLMELEPTVEGVHEIEELVGGTETLKKEYQQEKEAYEKAEKKANEEMEERYKSRNLKRAEEAAWLNQFDSYRNRMSQDEARKEREAYLKSIGGSD